VEGQQGDFFTRRGLILPTIGGQATVSDQLRIRDYQVYNDRKRPSDPSAAVQGNIGAPRGRIVALASW
jgi:hypothetical protein